MSHPTRVYLLTHRTATLTPSHKLATFDPPDALTIYHTHHTWHARFPSHNRFLYTDSITGVSLPFYIYVADAVDIPFMSTDLCRVQEYMEEDVGRRALPPVWRAYGVDTDRGERRRADWGDGMEFLVWEVVEVVMGEGDERGGGVVSGGVYFFGGEAVEGG